MESYQRSDISDQEAREERSPVSELSATSDQEARKKQTSSTLTLCTNGAHRYQNIVSNQRPATSEQEAREKQSPRACKPFVLTCFTKTPGGRRRYLRRQQFLPESEWARHRSRIQTGAR
jgi:hypothetical protein